MKGFKLYRVKVPGTTKWGKKQPPIETNYSVEVCQHKSISILYEGDFCNSFQLGDVVRFSPSVSFTGTITGITPARVTVCFMAGPSADPYKQYKYLNLYDFCRFNDMFETERAKKEFYAANY